VFYCRSGGRSTAAASLAVDAEVTEKEVGHLAGGIMGWDGHRLTGYPKIKVFAAKADTSSLLMTAMNLEKGAWRYYSEALKHASNQALADTFDVLSKAEIGHAKTIYRFWKETVTDPEDFDALYSDLAGDMMEGGITVTEAIERLGKMDDSACMGLIELAIQIEYSAYDLYRNAAEKAVNPDARDAFLTIAQAEKGHMRTLIKSIDACPG
jgi:rubrerythrin